jgi:hypothetical protein
MPYDYTTAMPVSSGKTFEFCRYFFPFQRLDTAHFPDGKSEVDSGRAGDACGSWFAIRAPS